MCGICGFLGKKSISSEELSRMNNSMTHRGPDDSGVEIVPLGNHYTGDNLYLGFGQRRLSILDLSKRGHQPMWSKDKRIGVVFNGEIYNFKEIKKELDYPFSSDCDTEVIIASYLKWGMECVNHLNGMFAIGLFDRENNALFLFRDRLGVKPLYYWLSKDGLVFGSELKPIRLFPGFNEEINRSVIPRYFVRKYICSPDTIYENVYKLEPGTYLRYDGIKVSKQKYWDACQKYTELSSNPIVDFEEAKKLLKTELENAVKYRFISDVPVGLFLSGGYDSSLITAVAQSISDHPLKTYSIGFSDEKISESAYAIAVSKHLGTEHTDMVITEEEMLGLIDKLPFYYDEPFADGSQLPTMLVSKLAKEHGVTVALTGDGGDEFYCGYGSYVPGVRNDARRFLSDLVRESKVKDFLLDRNAIEYKGVRYEKKKYKEVKDPQVSKMLIDMDTYLPDDICCKVDRATMRYSLEARCPFLDTNLVETSFKIPQFFKFFRGEGKYILKELTYDYIPQKYMDRPKQGFGIPYKKWLHGPLREMLLNYSDDGYLNRQGLFDTKITKAFLSNYINHAEAASPDYSDIVWAFLIFQTWWDEIVK